ncbi:alpha/beta fold hydrolase [Candidatus Binatia bacterium]|nr:alpha/beta fold hydrolase [Candidatus Binatia bacterium]
MAALASLFATTVVHAAPPPASLFTADVAMWAVSLSPDGNRIAYGATRSGHDALVVRSWRPGPKEPIAIDFPGDVRVRWVDWVKPERILIGLEMGQWEARRTFARVLSVSPDGSDQQLLFDGSRYGASGLVIKVDLDDVLAPLPDDPDHVIMEAWGDNLKMNVYRVGVRGERPVAIETGTPKTFHWVVDRDGTPRYRFDWDEKSASTILFVRPPGSGEWREAERWAMGEYPTMLPLGQMSERPGIAYVLLTPPGSDRAGIARYDLAQQKILGAIRANPEVDLDDVVTDRWTGRLLGVEFTDDTPRAVYDDAEVADVQQVVRRAYPDESSHLVRSSSRDGRVHLALVKGPKNPGTFVVHDADTNVVTEVGRVQPGLAAADLGERMVFRYIARDGTTVPAYLTLPPGAERHGLPLVVLPHGGPEGRDSLVFHPIAQFLATRGYAVLQPNFRGSTGYGTGWRRAGRRQWGLGTMQHDLSDAVSAAVAQGIADQSRVCIVGRSYGGYAALAGAAFTPELYRCAASMAGVSDLPRFANEIRMETGASSRVVAYWRTLLGDAAQDPAGLSAASPALHADRIVAPVLLLHGQDDWIVSVKQSEEMADRLREAGKPVTLVTYPRAGHGLRGPDVGDRNLVELERFLATQLGPTP